MADTEKITINMNAVELGKIDLLVEQGHYSNRTDFIRSAIRSQLEKHTVEVQQTVVRSSYAVGVIFFDRAELERRKAAGEKAEPAQVVDILSKLKRSLEEAKNKKESAS